MFRREKERTKTKTNREGKKNTTSTVINRMILYWSIRVCSKFQITWLLALNEERNYETIWDWDPVGKHIRLNKDQ